MCINKILVLKVTIVRINGRMQAVRIPENRIPTHVKIFCA